MIYCFDVWDASGSRAHADERSDTMSPISSLLSNARATFHAIYERHVCDHGKDNTIDKPLTTNKMSSELSGTTKQLLCMKQGGPFEVVEVPTPKLGPSDVLVRQKVIAFNLIDAKQRDYGILVKEWPRLLGTEGAGVIEAVGSAVDSFAVGDEVMAWEGSGASDPPWGGSFQDKVVLPAQFVAKKPSNLSLVEAASLP
jgi:hypothetical protein